MKKASISAISIAAFLAIGPSAALAEDAPVNCDTAKEDIAKLEAEKKSSLEQMDKTYQAISWIAYHFRWGNLHSKVMAGFRYLKLELENEPVAVDVAVRGPLIGFGVEF